MEAHSLGTRILGEVSYGPSASDDTVYTDSKTITAVQKNLRARGYSPVQVDGKMKEVVVDGKFGPVTEAALFQATGKHGPPDKAALMKIGLLPGGEPLIPPQLTAALNSAVTAVKTAESKAQVQDAASKAGSAAVAANAAPSVRQELANIQRDAANAKTEAELEAVKKRLQAALDKLEGKQGNWLSREVPNLGGMKVWQLSLVCIGTAAIGFGAYKIVTSTRKVSR